MGSNSSPVPGRKRRPAAARLPEIWKDVGNILAIRLDNIGDVIMLGPALRAVKRALPEAHLTLMCSPGGSQVAPLLPWVDDIFTLRAIWQDISGALPHDPQRELDLVEQVRSAGFDAALIFTSFSQSPYPPAYVCYLAGIPIRVGHSREFGGGLLSHWTKPPEDGGHQADRNLALVEAAGFPLAGGHLELKLPPGVQSRADQILRAAGIDPLAPFIAVAPGASAAARRYDPQRFATAARLLGQSGPPVVFIGSPREASLVEPYLHTAAQAISLVGKTSVAEMAAVIRRSALVIANNSAPLHIADAFDRPMVILYSGTELDEQWRPRFAPSRLLRRPTDCSPCYRFTCPYGMECLDIPPQEVASVALALLETASEEMPAPASRLEIDVPAAAGKRAAAAG